MLSVKNLSIAFGRGANKTTVVNDLSFQIVKGEALGLSGESGCGKTITSLAILQLLNKETSAVSGEVLFSEKSSTINLINASEKTLQNIRGKNISMIFQEPKSAFNPVIACGKQIAEVLMKHDKLSYKDAFEKTLTLFDKVSLSNAKELYYRYPHELSGGQLQRMAIAMAISCNPQLLIADEPTTALDVTTQKVILKLLKNIQQEYQMALLFISHDLKVIEHMTDRVMIMQKGRIAEENKTNEIFKNPLSEYTKTLIANQPSKLNLQIKKHHAEHQETLQPVIKANNLTKRYPFHKSAWTWKTEYFEAVKNVNFELLPGETLGIAGESGSGKSTLARLLLQLIPSDNGEMFFNNDLIQFYHTKNHSWRKKIQIVFQHPHHALDPLMQVGKAVEEPLIAFEKYNAGERKTKVEEWLVKVGLTAQNYHRYPHELSTGQKQRICIARALIIQPDVVVFDEAVSALDVSVQAQILQLIAQLKEKTPFSSIFISHNLEVLRLMCDRLLIMHNGEIIEQGATEKILDKPTSAYTQQLIDSIL